MGSCHVAKGKYYIRLKEGMEDEAIILLCIDMFSFVRHDATFIMTCVTVRRVDDEHRLPNDNTTGNYPRCRAMTERLLTTLKAFSVIELYGEEFTPLLDTLWHRRTCRATVTAKGR